MKLSGRVLLLAVTVLVKQRADAGSFVGDTATAAVARLRGGRPMDEICAKSGGGNCQRDFDSEYDGTECGCAACPNVKLCGQWAPSIFFDCHRGTCGDCAVFWGKALTFVAMTEECPICYEQSVDGVRHPSNCAGEHIFCIPCTRRLWWGDATDSSDESVRDYSVCSNKCPLCRKESMPDWVRLNGVRRGRWKDYDQSTISLR